MRLPLALAAALGLATVAITALPISDDADENDDM